MTNHKEWDGDDSDFTAEELAAAKASRLRWDEDLARMTEEGVWEDDARKPFEVVSIEEVLSWE